ncbi:MAG: hypothetical protein AAF684_09340, partial [Pseudomonadota bacterium]
MHLTRSAFIACAASIAAASAQAEGPYVTGGGGFSILADSDTEVTSNGVTDSETQEFDSSF